ncbi:MAG: TadE/TadG family type IV pilus assembly protein [Pseudomonadota bacterium]
MLRILEYTIVARRLHAAFQRFADNRRGAVALEFALIAIPFFLLIFGLLEVCMIFIISIILEHGTHEASRLIRTGQLQEGGIGQVAFKNLVCAELYGLLQCNEELSIDVKTFDSFGATENPSPIDSDGEFDDSGFAFVPGDSNEIVVVRVFYEWKLITPALTAPLANMTGNRRLLQATVAFRNEPFGTQNP